MANAIEQTGATIYKLKQGLRNGWQKLYARVLNWFQESKPLVDDLPRWIPKRPRDSAKTFLVMVIVIVGNWFFIHALDAGYDSPDKFEQVYYLNNILTLARDEVACETNVFGLNASAELDTYAKLIRVLGKDKTISIDQSIREYVQFSPTVVRSGAAEITISSHASGGTLQAALQKMASAGVVRLTPATDTRGEVYSFDLEMEVYRGDYSLGTFTETYHFRTDTLSEHSTVWIVVLLAVVASVLVADFTGIASDLRWRQYFKAMAALLADVLYYLRYPLELAMDVGMPPLFNLVLGDILRRILQQLIKQLEKLIDASNSKEAQALREQAQILLEKVDAHIGRAATNAAELPEQQKSLREVYEQTQALQKRLERLSRQPLRFRYHKAIVSKDYLRQALTQAKATVRAGYEKLKETVSESNLKRKNNRKLHDDAKKERMIEISDALNSYLQRTNIKDDMAQLGQYFPLETDPAMLFKTPHAFARGENEFLGGTLQLIYPSFSFPVTIYEHSENEPIWLTIRNENDEYMIAQAPPDQKRNITTGTATVPAVGLLDNDVNIKYKIKVAPANSIALKDALEFTTTPSDIDLIQPQPDPEPWFIEEQPPKEPKEVKLD